MNFDIVYSIPKQIANICWTEHDGISAIKFEAARLHFFLSGVFAAVAVRLLLNNYKLPNKRGSKLLLVPDRVTFVIATIIYSSSPPLFLAFRFWETRDQPQPGFLLETRKRTLKTRLWRQATDVVVKSTNHRVYHTEAGTLEWRYWKQYLRFLRNFSRCVFPTQSWSLEQVKINLLSVDRLRYLQESNNLGPFIRGKIRRELSV